MSVTKEELERYQRADAEGHPLISDEDYDSLMEQYVAEHGESKRPFNRQKQSADVNEIVGTLPKRYGVLKAMRPNQKAYKEWVEKQGTPIQSVVVQPKFDGCSVALDFKTGRFFTRGQVEDAEAMEVTDLFKNRINDFHRLQGTTSMKFEAIISSETFMREHLYNFYKSARAAAQGIMNSHDISRAHLIDLVPLRAYVDGKEYLPEFIGFFTTAMDDYNGIQSFIDQLLGDCATIELEGSTYAVDGVVVSVITSAMDAKHETGDIPIFVDPEREVAIKILELTAETKLISIDFQFGKQGRITPVAIFEPAEFGNISVDHATLSTIERVVSMNLRHGDTIKIMYNIVPYFISSQHDGDYPIPVPQKCPICGAQLDYSSPKLVRCTNVNCRGLRLGAIIRFAEKMRMVGVSKGNITRLYDAGIVQSIPDLLRLDPNKFMHLPGFGQTSAANIVHAIQEKTYQVRPDRILGALPINDTSEKTWKCIIDTLGQNYMDLFKWSQEDTFVDNLVSLGYIKNVKEAKLRRIIDGYIRHKDEIRDTLNLVTLLEPTGNATPYRGRVCMTGTRDKVVMDRLIEEGYDVGGFTTDCVAVIVPNADFTSAKTEKAKALGIPIYTLDEVDAHLYKPF